MFSRIHFLVSAVTLRGPWEAETSWPPILAKRYSEKRADDFSSISRFPKRSRFEKTPEADDGDGDDGRDDAEGIPVPETGDTPAAVPAGDDDTDDTLRDFSAEPQQHHHEDDDGLPFWGCWEKFQVTNQSRPSIHSRIFRFLFFFTLQALPSIAPFLCLYFRSIIN